MLMLVACGDTQTAETPTPEAKVVAKVEIEPSPTKESPKPEPTNLPTPEPSPTKAPATATATTKATEVAPTHTEVPPTATPTPLPTTPPPPTTTSGAFGGLAVRCELDETALTISCMAFNSDPEGQLTWTSNATTLEGNDTEWEFPLGDGLPIPDETWVHLEECNGPTCRLADTGTDTWQLVSEESAGCGFPEPEERFWNSPTLAQDGCPLPPCSVPMFSHPFADPDDVRGSFWHEDPNPHDHMVYWSTRPAGGDWGDPSPEINPYLGGSEPVQTYAPTDIYALNIGREVRESDGVQWVEWHGYTFYCEGRYSGWAHMDKPSEAILGVLREQSPVDWIDCPVESGAEALETSELGECRWFVYLDPVFPAGAPIWKSRGLGTGFVFSLLLAGLTAEQLREQPGYGYSVYPWRTSAGNAVCPLEFFAEPFRSEYFQNLSGGCGPMNQDVPGTAMEVWHTIPSMVDGTVTPKSEWDIDNDGYSTSLSLYQDSRDGSTHIFYIGDFTQSVPAGRYRIPTVSSGFVNRRWDEVVPGAIYCSELTEQTSMYGWNEYISQVVLVEVSADGMSIKIEGRPEIECGSGPYSFSSEAITLHR